MKQKLRTPRRALGMGVIAAAAVAAVLTATTASHAAAPAVGQFTVHPEYSTPQRAFSATADAFPCQSRPIDGSQGLRCYTPQQMQQAYGYSSLLASGVDGSGKTIVIIDPFSNPYVQQDLAIQDATFGLPAPSFTIVAPQGVPAFDPTDPAQINFAAEISLDVLSAHAMAPGAKIVLVEAASPNDSDLYAAEKYAVDHRLGDVMSQSFGDAESCVDPSYFGKWQDLLARASDQGWTIFASTGDSGAAQFNCDGSAAILSAAFPAVDPNVTAVGGTTLSADDPAGNYLGETAWTEPLQGCNPPAIDFPLDVNCSGGGFSTIFGRPSWQRSMVKGGQPHPGRGIPDVAYDAGVNGGVLVHVGVLLQVVFGMDPSTPLFFTVGGTSAGSPQWAGLAADADQLAGHDLGNINESLYHLAQSPPKYRASFHDVTTGNNDVAEIGTGYNAAPGWDPVTGLGTPNAASLLPALAGRH